MSEQDTPERRVRSSEMEQLGLFGLDIESWREHWWGMPSFVMGDARPTRSIVVNFFTDEDVAEFASKLGVKLTRRTDSMWYPPDAVTRPNEWEFVDA